MKKTLTFITLLICYAPGLRAQNIVNPDVMVSDDRSTTITAIETNEQYTIVHFESRSVSDSAWIQLNKEIYIQTDVSNAHFDFVKADNIALVPAKQYLKTSNGKLNFTVYFKKIPAQAKTIDIIERAGIRTDGVGYFNYYNVSLIKSASSDKNTVTDVTLSPPPADPAMNDSMSHMMTNMIKTMMDTQLDYYKQPGKLTDVAKLNKQYYDALIKAGFNMDQALKIITATPLLPKGSTNGQ